MVSLIQKVGDRCQIVLPVGVNLDRMCEVHIVGNVKPGNYRRPFAAVFCKAHETCLPMRCG